MTVWRRYIARTSAAALCLLAAASLAAAQSAADFYKNRNVDEYIGYSTGGAYDLYARSIGRFLGRHIAGNPTLVPKNMEGAGSLRLANFLYRVAPHDDSLRARGSAALLLTLIADPTTPTDTVLAWWTLAAPRTPAAR